MERMTLSEIAKALNSTSDSSREISKIVLDSRKTDGDSLFFAIAGDRFDGHDFLEQVFKTGSAAVCSKNYGNNLKGDFILVEDTRKAFLRLASYYRGKFDIPVVGITGSVGKTTTKEMISAVLRKKFNTVSTIGNFNNEIGMPQMCFLIDKDTGAAVLEMGMNHFGEIERLTRAARPNIAVITNIGESHIENLGSRDGILKAKLEIIEGMDKSSPLVLNADDPLLFKLDGKLDNRIIFYSIENKNADIFAQNIRQKGNISKFTAVINDSELEIELPAIGNHNILNALAACAVGDHLGLMPEQIKEGLADYTPAGMRQKITELGDITVIEDCYNASPDSIKAALSVLISLDKKGRKIAVLGDMMELGDYSREAHLKCGKAAKDLGIDKLFAYGANAKYFAEEYGSGAEFYSDKKELTDALEEYVKNDDSILFKASRAVRLEEVIEEFYKIRKDEKK